MDRRLASIGVVLTLLVACGERPPPVAPAPAAPPAAATAPAPAASGIAWFQGSIEAAFAAAKAENKPIFLYWTAEWCPPCHELKAHVFSRPDVIAKSRSFVPVYLDGDSEGAQRWGERFKVQGYPTAVVLRPDGTEVMRVGGGLDLEAYADALDVALADRRTVAAIVADLERGAAPEVEDCRRLAFHAWRLEPDTELARRSLSLEQAARRCPAEAAVERERLLVVAAGFAATAEAKELGAGKAPSPRLRSLADEVRQLADAPDAASRIGGALLFASPELLTAVRRAAPADAARFRDRWIALMREVARDPRESAGQQLYAYAAAIEGSRRLVDGPPPAELVQEARERIAAALTAHPDGYARTGVVNAAMNVYSVLDDREAARALLTQEAKTSKTPHYYLEGLAELEEKAGRKSAALDLYRRSYEEARGPASRFQWGAIYVDALVRLAPDDPARIRAAALQVLGELDGPNRLYGRARRHLGRLEASLEKWATTAERRAVLADLRTRVAPICGRYPADDSAREACDGFLRA